MGYGHFPAGILLLVHRLFGPFRRYRHGDDSPEPFTLFSPTVTTYSSAIPLPWRTFRTS